MSTVEKIKERLSITDVLGSYIDLIPAGENFKARCPFHHEKTPSFFISPARNTYYCFGCNMKGDIFSFIQEFESLDFKGSLSVLAERAGVPLEKYVRGSGDIKEDKKESLYEAMEKATFFFQNNLAKEKTPLLYLKSRGLSIESVKNARLGYALNDWHSLQKELEGKGISVSVLEEAGLVKRGEKGFHDRFRARIMFPIFDTSNRVIAFSGRADDPEDPAKYLNSPETPLFSKSKVLYGMHVAKRAIKEKGFVILVEGQMDLLMSMQAGFPNTVATSGTALTNDHLDLLRRFTDTLVIAFDRDEAGENAAFKAWTMALEKGYKIKVASISEGKDPADAVKENPEIWVSAVENATHIIDYFINSINKKNKDEQDRVTKEKILPLLRSIESSIDQSRFIRSLVSVTELSEEAIWSELQKIKVEPGEGVKEKADQSKNNSILRKAVALLLLLREKNKEEAEKFENKIKNIHTSFNDDNLNNESLYFEGVMQFGNSPDLDVLEDEILYELEEEELKQKFKRAMDEMRRAEIDNDLERVQKLLRECQELGSKISKIKEQYLIRKN